MSDSLLTSAPNPAYNMQERWQQGYWRIPKQEMTEKIIKNPITNCIKDSVNTSAERLNFAVPFLSSFSLSILNETNITKITDKRIVTRLDDCSVSSFDLPTLKSLLDLGFDIRYDNSIHLKLYITDNVVYITSSNLTKGGFEDNVELTVKVDSHNVQTCTDIFNEIWSNNKNNKLSYQLIESNWAKYEVLRKRDTHKKKDSKTVTIRQLKIDNLDIQQIIDEIYDSENDYTVNAPRLAFEANKLRKATKDKLLKKGFSVDMFYVSKGELRDNNLFYDFVYGYEANLAGTGLRELQFQTVFEHPDFENVIEYIYPEILGMKPWNFNDKDELLEFCNGIFDFDIPQYKESIPIRLVSYFYPEQFFPVFKLGHLEKICQALGLSTNAETQGERLFAYDTFLAEKMKALPFNNYIKSNLSYQIMYLVELYKRLSNGEKYDEIYDDYDKIWQKRMIKSGMALLTKLKVVK